MLREFGSHVVVVVAIFSLAADRGIRQLERLFATFLREGAHWWYSLFGSVAEAVSESHKMVGHRRGRQRSFGQSP